MECKARTTTLRWRATKLSISYTTSLNRSCRLHAHYDPLRFSSSICFSSSAIRARYPSLSLFNRTRYSSCATRWKPIDLNRSWDQDSEGKFSAVGAVWFGVCLLETYFTRCTLNSFPISWRVAQKRAEVTAPGRARRYPADEESQQRKRYSGSE